VTQQFLNIAHIHAVFQKMSGKAVAQGVKGSFLFNANAEQTIMD